MKRTNLFIVLLALTLTVLLVVGCSDRGTNFPEQGTITTGGPSPMLHVFYNSFVVQVQNPIKKLQGRIYIPDGSIPWMHGSKDNPKVPLLVLLPPQDGDEYFYWNHGLETIADELISTGQIEPMIIACIENDQVFGGYFYAGDFEIDSTTDYDPIQANYAFKHSGLGLPSGAWDKVIGTELIDYLYNSFISIVDTSPGRLAIGGVGMGAYGAYRAAILNPGKFCAISAIDGPLDFDGADGSSGLIDLVDDVFAEQGLTETTFRDFDTLGSWPISRMFVGGALAFSPHDTALIIRNRLNLNTFTMAPVIYDIGRETIDHDATLVDDIISQAFSATFSMGFHLPFDSTATMAPEIWDAFWLPNNLENLHILGNELDSVDMWFGTAANARYGYHDQTMSWIGQMRTTYGDQVKQVKQITGYDGNPGGHNQYLSDQIKEILIFHSNAFNK